MRGNFGGNVVLKAGDKMLSKRYEVSESIFCLGGEVWSTLVVGNEDKGKADYNLAKC